MIVKDCANTLGKCLESVKLIADELIIADTGSKDNTKEISKSFNAEIVDVVWKDDFSAARNESLKHATKDWIFVIDGDEWIDDPSAIKEAVKKDTDGIKLIQRNYFREKISEQGVKPYGKDGFASYQDIMPVRLFRRGYSFRNRVHESVEESIKEKGGRISACAAIIHHPRPDMAAKRELYIKLGLRQLDENPAYPKTHYELGKAYMQQNKFDNAIEMLDRGLKLISGKQFSWLIAPLNYELGRCFFALERYDAAKKHFEEALQFKEANAHANFMLGMVHHTDNKPSSAVKYYKRAIELNVTDPVAFANLGTIYLDRNEYHNALPLLQEAVKLGHPQAAKIQQILDNIKVK